MMIVSIGLIFVNGYFGDLDVFENINSYDNCNYFETFFMPYYDYSYYEFDLIILYITYNYIIIYVCNHFYSHWIFSFDSYVQFYQIDRFKKKMFLYLSVEINS